MKLESGMLGGRFARRLFAVFFLSAVAPVLTLSLISFNRVSDQLVIQNQEQLEQEAKATGLGIFERLTLLEAEMQLVDTQFSEVENASASVLTAAQRDRMNEKFKTLGCGSMTWAPMRRFSSLWIERFPPISMTGRYRAPAIRSSILPRMPMKSGVSSWYTSPNRL